MDNHAGMNEIKSTNPGGPYRPKLAFYHPNGKGTGCALKLELRPAQDDVEGAILMTVANQISIADRRGPNPTFARFDWENSLCVKLNFNDLCKFLQVFRGECESVDEGRGLYHRSAKATTRIALRHVIEPAQGYLLELYRNPVSGPGETHAHILLTPAESLGLCESISGAMYLISFGMPGASAVPNARVKETRNAYAA